MFGTALSRMAATLLVWLVGAGATLASPLPDAFHYDRLEQTAAELLRPITWSGAHLEARDTRNPGQPFTDCGRRRLANPDLSTISWGAYRSLSCHAGQFGLGAFALEAGLRAERRASWAIAGMAEANTFRTRTIDLAWYLANGVRLAGGWRMAEAGRLRDTSAHQFGFLSPGQLGSGPDMSLSFAGGEKTGANWLLGVGVGAYHLTRAFGAVPDGMGDSDRRVRLLARLAWR